MHVQHSEQTARDQLVIGRLPADAAQVTLGVESMPESAVVNSTTHNAAQLAESPHHRGEIAADWVCGSGLRYLRKRTKVLSEAD